MNEINCENVLMAKMAGIDGEETEFSVAQMKAHLEVCENCQNLFERMQTTDDLLKRQTRREPNPDLWAAIEQQIGAEKTSALGSKPFILIGVLLLVYKLLEIFPERDLGLAFKLVPLVLIVALFLFLKENPFKINTELKF